jgi:hypothetical protein
MMGDVESSAGGVAAPPGVASFCGFSGLEPHKGKLTGRKLKLTAIGPNGAFIAKGQTAKALRALVAAGPHGVTAQEVAGWAFRLAAYCHVLRRKRGLSIKTLREKHEGGWHGRHVLLSAVTIIDGGARHG